MNSLWIPVVQRGFSWNRPTPLLATPRLLATARSYLSKDATIEMKVTKALTTGIAVLAFAAPAAGATATLTAVPAQADPDLPCSTDPRFLECPGATADQNFLYYMERKGITDADGQQALINVAHDICSELKGGATYDQEVTKLLASGAKLTSDEAVALVEDAWEFYCPISLRPR